VKISTDISIFAKQNYLPMRRLGANYVVCSPDRILKNAYVELNDQGVITDIVEFGDNFREISKLEFFNGILVPGFVNAHCHLELSHLKKEIQPQKGLPSFIDGVRNLRFSQDESQIQLAMQQADRQMRMEGIVLVGDISNTSDTVELKTKSSISYHTFVEVFGADRYRAAEVFERATETKAIFESSGLKASIVPHATYSVSERLFEKITDLSYAENAIISIHNQETASENQMFIDKTGELFDYFKSSGIDYSSWYPTGRNALQSALVQLPKCSKVNLVHNTYTELSDIEKALEYNSHLYWTFCPNANLYIENRLPHIPIFVEKNLKICIGTDSLASNDRLSILNELKTIQVHYPEIPFTTLLAWATINGAELFDLQNIFGTLEIGKKPGVNLIENFDFVNFKLKNESQIKVLF